MTKSGTVKYGDELCIRTAKGDHWWNLLNFNLWALTPVRCNDISPSTFDGALKFKFQPTHGSANGVLNGDTVKLNIVEIGKNLLSDSKSIGLPFKGGHEAAFRVETVGGEKTLDWGHQFHLFLLPTTVTDNTQLINDSYLSLVPYRPNDPVEQDRYMGRIAAQASQADASPFVPVPAVATVKY